MDDTLKQRFLERWQKYFPGAELLVTWYHTGRPLNPPAARSAEHCLIGRLTGVREGHTLVYSAQTPGCMGGKRYAGLLAQLRPNLKYFLSCSIPGKLERERYKKSPELVRAQLSEHLPFKAPGQYLASNAGTGWVRRRSLSLLCFLQHPMFLRASSRWQTTILPPRRASSHP